MLSKLIVDVYILNSQNAPSGCLFTATYVEKMELRWAKMGDVTKSSLRVTRYSSMYNAGLLRSSRQTQRIFPPDLRQGSRPRRHQQGDRESPY